MEALLNMLRKMAEQAGDDLEKAEAMILYAYVLYGHDPHSNNYFRQGWELAQKLNHPRALVIGLIYDDMKLIMSSQYEAALAVCAQMHPLVEQVDQADVRITYLAHLGVIYRSLGNYDRALEYLLSALRICESGNGLTTILGKISITWVFNFLGGLYGDLKDYDAAMRYYQRGAEFLRDFPYTLGNVYILNGIGAIHRARQEFDLALRFHRESLPYSIGHPVPTSLAMTEMANCYERMGDWEQALHYHQESLRLRQEVHYLNAALTNQIAIGEIYIKQGRLSEAEDILLQARQQGGQLKVKPKLARVYELLTELSELKQDTAAALDFYRQFHALSKEIFSEESQNKLKNLQVLHGIENAEKEAEIHRLKNVELARLNAEIQAEREKSDRLLLNILPEEVAAELKEYGRAEPKHYDKVTIIFTDFKGFTHLAGKMTPQALLKELDTCFAAFDAIVERHGLEKIKTIGDAYMAAGGIPIPNDTNPTDVVSAALEMRGWMEDWKREKEASGQPVWEIRIGVHTGPLVAGVIGKKKFAYDVWGDTVNLASRMESSGEPGKVNISGATYELMKDNFFCEHRGKVYAKNKGEVEMYFVASANIQKEQ